jgi:hypothetical protein
MSIHLSTRCRIVVFILDSKRNDDDGVNTRTDSSFEKALTMLILKRTVPVLVLVLPSTSLLSGVVMVGKPNFSSISRFVERARRVRVQMSSCSVQTYHFDHFP